ncbi:hypothetical protein JCM11641_004315 [Rhodosporidiobolus odoratus]
MSSPSTSPDSFAVIGGEGFLGSALITALTQKHGPSRVASFGLTQRTHTPGYRFFRTDITSFTSILSSLTSSAATTVFHTASPHANATAKVWEQVNVEGTKEVVRACREAGVKKLVFTSSMTVVYEQGVGLKNVDERVPRVGEDGTEATYAGTKAKAEKIVLDSNGKDGLLTCALRLGGIIGPGDRQVLPGFIGVYKAGQSAFQMGSNLNLFDFVTLKNVVHAHLLAAEKLDAPPLDARELESRSQPVACTVGRRVLPTSRYPDVIDSAKPPEGLEQDLALPAARNRFDQFHTTSSSSLDPSQLSVAGQSFFITNGEPVPFWSFARAVYYAYSNQPQRWWNPIVFPGAVGMFFATMAEAYARVVGREPEEMGVTKKYMAYVLEDMYFDIERARRVLGYEPIESLEEGIKSGVEWYKQDEFKQQHALQALHLNWHLRLRSLSDRVIALLSAKAAGEASCWAGKATENHIRTVQRAADEAKFVEERLRKAVRWCRREKVGKVPVKGLIKAAAGARKKHGRNSPSSLRPVHSTFPPSLLDLPYPLPQAQEPNLYTLSLPSFSMTPFPETPRRRRPQERDEEREAQQGEALPVYRALADEQAGERTVQRAEMGGVGGEEQYARELAELLRE